MAYKKCSQFLEALRAFGKVACPLVSLCSPIPVTAQSFLEDMELIGVGVGGLSSLADSFSRRSGGLSDGSRYSFSRYYSSDVPDLRITMLSPISRNLGIIWGLGTGESGEKYHIEPSLKIGFLAARPVGRSGLLSFSVSTVQSNCVIA